MPTSSSAPGDPNNWVHRPPSTFVKVVNVTSREAINGQFGLVLHYATDRGRYVVHMVLTQEQVSLKPDNLIKATMIEQVQAQWQLLKHDPNVHRQLRQVYTAIQQHTGNRIAPEYLAVMLLLLFIVASYFFGFNKMIMLLSMLLLFMALLGPDLAAGATWKTALSHLPTRTKTIIRDNIPYLGPKIASNNYMTAALVGLIVAIMVKSLFFSPTTTATTLATTTTSTTPLPSRSLSISRQDMEHYYKLGFDDATAVKPFGASLPNTEEVLPLSPRLGGDEFDDFPLLSQSHPHNNNKKSSSPFNFSTLMSMFVVGRTVYELGNDATAATGRRGWNPSLAMANLQTLEVWKMGLLAFSVYRIISAFIK